MWCIHTVEEFSPMERNGLMIYAMAWMNLRVITLSEKSQAKNSTYYMIPFIYISRKSG